DLIGVQKQAEPGSRVNAEMLFALGADVQVLFKIFFPDDLAAILTLYPQAFSADFFLARTFQLTGLAFEPGHGISDFRIWLWRKESFYLVWTEMGYEAAFKAAPRR